MGFIKMLSNSVKRKVELSVVWDDASYKTPLARRDTIRTDNESIVSMVLIDGTELRMDENSMVLLDIKDKQKMIDFLYGKIHIHKPATTESVIDLKTGDLRAILKEGEFTFNIKDNGEVEIFVVKGEGFLQKAQKTFSLKESFFSFFSKDKEPEFVDSYSKLTSPNNLQFFFTDKPLKELNFSWLSKIEPNRIQFSTKVDFSVIYKEQLVNGSEAKISFPIGSFFWRVIPVNQRPNFKSEVRKFIVLKDSPFSIRSPETKAKFTLQENKVLVNFAWDSLENVQKYILEVSNSSNFEKIDRSLESETNIFSLDYNTEGTYFYRVRAIYRNLDFPEKISSIQSFTIVKQEDINEPELLSPIDSKSISTKEKILFGWKYDPSFKKYNLVLSENKEFSTNTKKINTNNNYIVMESLQKGKQYYWKIEGITSNGKSVFSESRNFQISDSETSIQTPTQVLVKQEVKKKDQPPKTTTESSQTPTQVPLKQEVKKKDQPPTTTSESPEKEADPNLKPPKSRKNSEVKYEETED
ncbi:MAG: FecR domain-containing protein [Leptospiraceae bacterium]|nr:FecR domain-containing protein [Leptospiraceae bacterium]